MPNIKLLQRNIKFLVLIALLVATPHPASAQGTPTITATGTVGDNAYCGTGCNLTITFLPAGGPVTGNALYEGGMVRIIHGGESTMACPGTATLSMVGSFAGGDGGAASGTFTWKLEADNSDCSMHGTITGSWSGNLYANGSGSGTLHADNTDLQWGGQAAGADAPWQVSFSAEEFQTALGESDSAPVAPEDAPSGPVTSESIYNTYGIKVEDTFSEDPNVSKSWSDEELILLNDVLKELPPGFAKKLAVARIVRASRDPDHPDWVGGYYPCDGRGGKEPCTAETATIRIYDGALHAFDFENDPDGYKEFKGTILHELTHALQSYKDPNEIYLHPTEQLLQKYARSPLVQNYMDATRPVTDMNEPGFWQNNGWNLVLNKWNLTGANGNETPTNYAKKNPQEDLSESVMMYVYDPQKLQNSSAKRYTFIRDQIFGGIEYEDGHQKQP